MGYKVFAKNRKKYIYILTYRILKIWEIIWLSNSDFVGCKYILWSTLGYIFMLVEGVVFLKNVKRLIASTIDVKFITCYKAIGHRIWLQNFVYRLQIVGGKHHYNYFVTISRYWCISITNNGNNTKSKNVDVKLLFAKERV